MSANPILASISHTRNPGTAYSLDTAAAAVVVGSWTDYIPSIAAGLSIIYFLIQIWQSETVKGWRVWVRSKLSRARPQ